MTQTRTLTQFKSPIPGAFDRIARLRSRYSQLTANIAHYEQRVASQTSQLNHMSQPNTYDNYTDLQDAEEEEDAHRYPHYSASSAAAVHMTAEDLRLEEEEIRALERKKQALEERVSGMEKDIGGLMRCTSSSSSFSSSPVFPPATAMTARSSRPWAHKEQNSFYHSTFNSVGTIELIV
jgi:chromosome segregation ATPase